MKVSLVPYMAAGFPVIALATSDEDRAITDIFNAFGSKFKVLKISCLAGMLAFGKDSAGRIKSDVAEPAFQYPHAFDYAKKNKVVLVVTDYQHTIKNSAGYRMLRDSLTAWKAKGSFVVLIAPSWSGMPAEITHDIKVIEDNLPTRDELRKALDVCFAASGTNAKDVSNIPQLLDAGTGLTLAEFENAAAFSFVKNGSYDSQAIMEEKIKLVKQCGLVEISEPTSIETLGGLSAVKRAITHEILPSMSNPKIRVSGMILDGVPGTGKSHAVSILGGMLGWLLIRVDVGRLKGSKVGESEANMAQVFKLVRAVAPCVVFFDELEKGVGGHASSAQSDGGSTLGMVGILLTQMSEIRKAAEPIFFAATTNDYSKLPTELCRRFEIRFFVDTPTANERIEIAKVKLADFDCAEPIDGLASALVDFTDEWTGAEIEDLVRSAARLSQCNITLQSLRDAAEDIKPQAKTNKRKIDELRDWGRANLRLANTPDTAVTNERTITRG